MHTMPEQVNLVEVRTVWGYKTFALYQGDITLLDGVTDILIISAFDRSYEPLTGSVIGALHDRGVSVAALARDCYLDLRTPFHCWVSQPLGEGPFKRIVCVETPYEIWFNPDPQATERTIRQAIEDVFVVLSMLEVRGIPVATLALPMLGTGMQRYDPHVVMRALLELSTAQLLRSAGTEQIRFVAHSPAQAQKLAEAMDDHLGRVKVLLPKGDLVDTTKREIDGQIKLLAQTGSCKALDDLHRLVLDEQATPLGFGITGRDLADAIVDDILDVAEQQADLNGKIRKLQKPKYEVPEWVKEYLHVLRTIGNEFAHGQATARKASTTLGPLDLELQLLCLRRVLKFWADFRRERSLAETTTS